MNKSIIIILIAIIIVAVWAVLTLKVSPSTQTSISTTISTTSIPPSSISTTTENTTTTVKPVVAMPSCNNVSLSTQSFDTEINKTCNWKGGILGLWTASGNSYNETITLTGANGVTYINQISNYSCITLSGSYQIPNQTYTLVLKTGNRLITNNTKCNTSSVVLNSTIKPKNTTVYTKILNGNFSSGTYFGWNVTGTAFGQRPLNITNANNIGCFPEQTKWSGNSNTYYASTYSCSLNTQSQGNLTSSLFVVNKPFLNFQIIGYYNPYTYIEILYNNTPYVTAYYNTYRIAKGANQTFMFRNASLPLTSVYGKAVRIRVVVKETQAYNYMLIGNFTISKAPNQYHGILVNLSMTP